ncbi:MAG: DUF2878 domain-containing protein [Vicinamibacterales bacterium]
MASIPGAAALAAGSLSADAAVSNLINYALYQAGWFCAVLSAAAGRPWTGGAAALALLAAHIWLAERRRDEATLALAAGAVGLVADSIPTAAGLLSFPHGEVTPWLCAPWVVVLWMQFATTLRFGLRWIATSDDPRRSRRLRERAAGTGVGERLGAVVIGTPRPAAPGRHRSGVAGRGSGAGVGVATGRAGPVSVAFACEARVIASTTRWL